MVRNCVESNFFSVLVNGSPASFFPSFRGVKQGDPLFPFLFILVVNVLSQGLDNLAQDCIMDSYSLSRGCLPVSHLSYVDDIIIFTSYHSRNLRQLMDCLKDYEIAFGQRIFFKKFFFYTEAMSTT